MRSHFSPIEPYRTGTLPASDGHIVYFEECGNPNGIPVLFLHGGPGSGCRAEHRQFFDAGRFRAVLFDQRGCGRSTPLGSLQSNTTPDLIADIEALRYLLGIERWIVFGGSWGATLTLAYVVVHPARVAGMVLRGVFLASAGELDWYINGLGQALRQARAELDEGLTSAERGGLIQTYAARTSSMNPAVRDAAALAWLRYEAAAMNVPLPDTLTPQSRGKALVQLHYLANGCFFDADDILRRLRALQTIPTIVVQGARDRICPPAAARSVAAAIPGAELVLLADEGHAASAELMASALIDALDRVAEKYGNS